MSSDDPTAARRRTCRDMLTGAQTADPAMPTLVRMNRARIAATDSTLTPSAMAFERSVPFDESRADSKTRTGFMNPLQRARWQLAVLVELAEPGHMHLRPVLDDCRDVLDFTWLEASPTSTRAFGCAGEDLVGRSLRQVLADCEMDPSVVVAYRLAFLEQRSRVAHIDGKDGMVLHQISSSRWGVTVKVTSQTAVERVLSAELVARQLESNGRVTQPGESLCASAVLAEQMTPSSGMSASLCGSRMVNNIQAERP